MKSYRSLIATRRAGCVGSGRTGFGAGHVGGDRRRGQRRVGPEPETLAAVVVTARNREESAQDVPIPVTVLDAEKPETFGIHDRVGSEFYTPNIELNPPGGNARKVSAKIRGLGVAGRMIPPRRVSARSSMRREPLLLRPCPGPTTWTPTASRCSVRRAPCRARTPRWAPSASSPRSRAS